MGQYHILVNLDKGEYIMPHELGAGLKLVEQLGCHPGTGSALIVLLASASNGAGSGDLRSDNAVIGSWCGDRIAMVGDYDDKVYSTPNGDQSGGVIFENENREWKNVSGPVADVLCELLDGKFEGDGWLRFVEI